MWKDVLLKSNIEDYFNPSNWEVEHSSKRIPWPEAKKLLSNIMENVPKQHIDRMMSRETALIREMKRNMDAFKGSDTTFQDWYDTKIQRFFSESLAEARKLKNKFSGKTKQEAKDMDLQDMVRSTLRGFER